MHRDIVGASLNQNGISKLKNITKLNIGNNPKISNVNHLINLINLNADGFIWKCGLDQNGISELKNITELNVSGNSKISNVNHLINLINLNASQHCGRFA